MSEWMKSYGKDPDNPYAQYGLEMPELSGLTGTVPSTGSILAQTERELMEEAAKKELRTDVGVSAGLAGLQLAAELYPTRTQREQKAELAELERQQEAGESALDPKVSALMDQAAAAGGRIAGEMGLRLAAQEAASGVTSAGAQQRGRQAVMETAAKGKREAGLQKAQAELQAEQQRAGKIASMRAQRFEEEKGRRQAASQTLAKAAILTGKLRAEKPLEIADIESLQNAGFDHDQIMEIWDKSHDSMRSQDKYMEYMLYAGQFGPTSVG
jgi:hypothetical protein